MCNNAFHKISNTYAITANSTAPDGIQIAASVESVAKRTGNVRVFNDGVVTIHLGVGASAAAAKANAVAASSGSPASGLPVGAGATEIFAIPDDAYVSAYAASAATVYLTRGDGL